MSKTFKIFLETAIVGGVISSFSSSFAENETQEDQEQNSEEMISTLAIKKLEYAKLSLLKKPSSNVTINSNGIIKLSDTSSTAKSSFEISGPPNSVAWLVVQNQVELKNGNHLIKVEISKNIQEKVNTGSDGKIILDLSNSITKIDENVIDGIYSGFCTITVTY